MLVGHSSALIASILAILKAGCAYVPLDPRSPRMRTAFMIDDSGVEFCISDTANLPLAESFGMNCLCVDEMPPPREHHADWEPLPGNIAYVLYTFSFHDSYVPIIQLKGVDGYIEETWIKPQSLI